MGWIRGTGVADPTFPTIVAVTLTPERTVARRGSRSRIREVIDLRTVGETVLDEATRGQRKPAFSLSAVNALAIRDSANLDGMFEL